MEASFTEGIPWVQVSTLIAERVGLEFLPERWPDLQRSLAAAAEEFGLPDVASCCDWLLAAPLSGRQLRVLASHLTIGETYFFRDERTFEVLAESVLPKLIHERRSCGRRLRFWSAACCTGEEPYSLAILLHQIIPDLQDWDVTILATDINERFLQKATAGVYGEWSFRKPGMEFKQRYFEKAEKSRYAIRPDIKRLVSFAPSNLVEDVFPSEVNDTHAMDVILCRNALMYFGSPQAKKVVAKFRASLVPDGWLVLSPSEGSQALCTGFVPVNFPGVILYQNREAGPGLERFRVSARIEGSARLFVPETAPRLSCVPGGPDAQGLATCAAPALEDLAGVESLPGRGAAAHALCLEGRYAEAADHLLNSWGSHDPHHARVLPLLARGLANQGKLEEALEWCDRWLGLDRLDTSAHYLRAVVLQELGESVRARHSLQRAIYLHPDFVMAHFALGNLARSCGQANGAVKHFANTSHLLRDHHADDLLPESDGLTAGRLREIVASLAAMERAS